jgi:hypothetical protein
LELNVLIVNMYYINVAHISIDFPLALQEDIPTSIP